MSEVTENKLRSLPPRRQYGWKGGVGMTNPHHANLGEIGGKERNHRVNDVVAKRPQPTQDWLPGANRRSLAERYAEAELEIHAHFVAWINGSGPVTDKLCATDRAGTEGLNCTASKGYVVGDDVTVATEDALMHSEQRHVKQAVLIDARKLMEFPESVRIPSLARLQSLNDCLSTWVDVPYSPSPLSLNSLRVWKMGNITAFSTAGGSGLPGLWAML